MSWYFLSLLCAVSVATADALTKRFFSHLLPYEMGLIRIFFTLIWLGTAAFFIPRPNLDGVFWAAMAAALPLEVLAFICYMRAIKVSPLSLSLPFLAFTPIFVILTGRILLGEQISTAGFAGIMLIVIGSYLLNLSRARTGLLGPLQAVFREPGSRLMLFVSLLYSMTASLGKLAITHSSPSFFAIVYYFFFAFSMAFFFPAVKKARAANVVSRPLIGILVGAVAAVGVFSHMIAISMVQAAYMLSLKRTSILFGVLYGAFWFKEERIGERMAGAVIMVTGAVLIGRYG
jgi:drug/metabolite transporter (DMT)-like permease